MTLIAVIDIGSNGIRFSVHPSARISLPRLMEERIGLSLLPEIEKTSFLSELTITKTIKEIKRYKRIIKGLEQDCKVKMVATESLRSCENKDEVIQRLESATGWKLIILTKEEESLFTSYGIIATLNQCKGLALDLGGGSLEINYINSSEEIKRLDVIPQSLKYGSHRLRKMLENTSKQGLINKFNKDFMEVLNDGLKIKLDQIENVYFAGGGLRCLSYLYINDTDLDKAIVNGMKVPRIELIKILEKYYNMEKETIKKLNIPGISKDRKKALRSNCWLAINILEHLSYTKDVIFCSGGIRHGIVYDMLEDKEKKKDPMLDGIEYHIESSPKLNSETEEYLFELLCPLFKQYKVDTRILAALLKLSQLGKNLSKSNRFHYGLKLVLLGGELAWLPSIYLNQRVELTILLVYSYLWDIQPEFFDLLPVKMDEITMERLKALGSIIGLILLLEPLADRLKSGNPFLKYDIRFESELESGNIILKLNDINDVTDTIIWKKRLKKTLKEKVRLELLDS